MLMISYFSNCGSRFEPWTEPHLTVDAVVESDENERRAIAMQEAEELAAVQMAQVDANHTLRLPVHATAARVLGLPEAAPRAWVPSCRGWSSPASRAT